MTEGAEGDATRRQSGSLTESHAALVMPQDLVHPIQSLAYRAFLQPERTGAGPTSRVLGV